MTKQMTNPFHDWRNPSKPYAWFSDYMDKPHVIAVNQAISNWHEGLTTLRELMWTIVQAYDDGYTSGNEDAHYQVPAIRTTVEIFPDRVILWNMSRPIDHGRITYLPFLTWEKD